LFLIRLWLLPGLKLTPHTLSQSLHSDHFPAFSLLSLPAFSLNTLASSVQDDTTHSDSWRSCQLQKQNRRSLPSVRGDESDLERLRLCYEGWNLSPLLSNVVSLTCFEWVRMRSVNVRLPVTICRCKPFVKFWPCTSVPQALIRCFFLRRAEIECHRCGIGLI